MSPQIHEQKQQLRQHIWRLMEQSGVALFPLPCTGRIPNYIGADVAAEKLRQLPEWKHAEVIFVNPDSPQRKVRENVLLDGKTLVMASPRLTRGFIMITPREIKGREHAASTIKGAFKYGVAAVEIPKPDLIVEGSVAVDLQGHRLGKGHGYGDKEVSMLKERFGEIPVATTVHDIQLVRAVPCEETDQPISIIVTPTRIIRVKI